MKKITDIDENFKVETNIKREHLKLYDVEQAPFRVYGVFRENDRFCRLPEAVAKRVNEGVHLMYDKTAGGRVRFMSPASVKDGYENDSGFV